jgi:thiamine biosynthesis lipoprotein
MSSHKSLAFDLSQGNQLMAVFQRYGLSILLLLVLLVLWLSRSPSDAVIHELSGATMGTSYSIKLLELPSVLSPDEFVEQISALLHKLDREQMSTYASDSELSRFNRSSPEEFFPVSADLAEVVQLAQEISELTDGAFDVTVGPLVNRWGFGPRNFNTTNLDASRVPSDAELLSLLQQVGYQKLEVSLSPPALRKRMPVYVDLSGIAKGYAVDKVADYLDSLQLESYFIEIGGELRIKGLKPDGDSWIPAIEKPVDAAPQVFTVFYSHGESIAVAGSGDYRNYFEQNGVRYSHEINPRSGKPTMHTLAAVYVISETAARADALATAFMVMGEQEAFTLAQEIGLAAYFISYGSAGEEFSARYTDNFTHYLQKPE